MGLPIRYLNESQADTKLTKTISGGQTVVNAPRPLGGDDAWEGDFITGRHYAAGDRAQWEKHWADYGASEIILLTNRQILQMAVDKAASHPLGGKLEGLLEKKGEQFLREISLSWFNVAYCLNTSFEEDIAAVDFSKLRERSQPNQNR